MIIVKTIDPQGNNRYKEFPHQSYILQLIIMKLTVVLIGLLVLFSSVNGQGTSTSSRECIKYTMLGSYCLNLYISDELKYDL